MGHTAVRVLLLVPQIIHFPLFAKKIVKQTVSIFREIKYL